MDVADHYSLIMESLKESMMLVFATVFWWTISVCCAQGKIAVHGVIAITKGTTCACQFMTLDINRPRSTYTGMLACLVSEV